MTSIFFVFSNNTQPLGTNTHLMVIEINLYTIYPIYPRINLNSIFEEPGPNPVFHFFLISLSKFF